MPIKVELIHLSLYAADPSFSRAFLALASAPHRSPAARSQPASPCPLQEFTQKGSRSLQAHQQGCPALEAHARPRMFLHVRKAWLIQQKTGMRYQALHQSGES